MNIGLAPCVLLMGCVHVSGGGTFRLTTILGVRSRVRITEGILHTYILTHAAAAGPPPLSAHTDAARQCPRILTQSVTPRTSSTRAVCVHSQDSRVRTSARTCLQVGRAYSPFPPHLQPSRGGRSCRYKSIDWTIQLGRRWTGQREALAEQAANLLAGNEDST